MPPRQYRRGGAASTPGGHNIPNGNATNSSNNNNRNANNNSNSNSNNNDHDNGNSNGNGNPGSNSRKPSKTNNNRYKQQNRNNGDNNNNNNNNNRRRYHNNNNNNNNNQQQQQKPKQFQNSKPKSVMIMPEESNDDPSTICTVCASKAKDWAMGPCSHAICGDCVHRLRVLYKRDTCVICNKQQSGIIIIPLKHYTENMSYDEAIKTLPNQVKDNQVSITFIDDKDNERMKYFQNLRGFMCSNDHCVSLKSPVVFSNANEFRAHAKTQHNSVYCEICFNGGKSFISELKQYSLDNNSLRNHLKQNHPQCKFCRKYFLDDEKLYQHLQEVHETCFICERRGRIHEYYRSFQELERHYQKQHFMCNDQNCRGVVFATSIELQAHIHSVHSNNGSNSSSNQRNRGLRVDLRQLHQGSDPLLNDHEDVARERERQAARRRAFLSSHVVFSGTLNLDDDPPEPNAPPSTTNASSSVNHSVRNNNNNRNASTTASSSSSSSAPGATVNKATTNAAEPAPAMPEIPRPPDDGKFHPSRLPRDTAESAVRNAVLVRRMRTLLDPASYEQFKLSSSQFQNGTLDVDEYFDIAVDVFGLRSAIRDVLPELVALLPSPLLREPLLRTCFKKTDTSMELDPAQLAVIGLNSLLPATSSNPDNPTTSSGTTSTNNYTNNTAQHQAVQNRGNNPNQQDHFPTLNGGPLPPTIRKAEKLRRFGAPGPEEFPRLGKPIQTNRASSSGTTGVAKTPNNNSLNQAPISAVPPRPGNIHNIVNASHAGSTSSSSDSGCRGALETTKTAAALLRSKPVTVQSYGNLGNGPGRSTNIHVNNNQNRARFESSAFPSLASNSSSVPPVPPPAPIIPSGNGFAGVAAGVATATRTVNSAANGNRNNRNRNRDGRAEISETAFPTLGGGSSSSTAFPSLGSSNTVKQIEKEAEPAPALESDVSLRAGAVWGGAGRSSKPKKRGPGQGKGRRPATPPRVALKAMGDREEQAEMQNWGGVEGDNEEDANDEGNGNASASSSSSSKGKLRSFDVVEIARERRRHVQNSALPGFAKSAYGGGSEFPRGNRKF